MLCREKHLKHSLIKIFMEKLDEDGDENISFLELIKALVNNLGL